MGSNSAEIPRKDRSAGGGLLLKVGCTIEILWPLDGKYYRGVITKLDTSNNDSLLADIEYEDGKCEVGLEMGCEKYRLVNNNYHPRKKQQRTSADGLEMGSNSIRKAVRRKRRVKRFNYDDREQNKKGRKSKTSSERGSLMNNKKEENASGLPKYYEIVLDCAKLCRVPSSNSHTTSHHMDSVGLSCKGCSSTRSFRFFVVCESELKLVNTCHLLGKHLKEVCPYTSDKLKSTLQHYYSLIPKSTNGDSSLEAFRKLWVQMNDESVNPSSVTSKTKYLNDAYNAETDSSDDGDESLNCRNISGPSLVQDFFWFKEKNQKVYPCRIVRYLDEVMDHFPLSQLGCLDPSKTVIKFFCDPFFAHLQIVSLKRLTPYNLAVDSKNDVSKGLCWEITQLKNFEVMMQQFYKRKICLGPKSDNSDSNYLEEALANAKAKESVDVLNKFLSLAQSPTTVLSDIYKLENRLNSSFIESSDPSDSDDSDYLDLREKQKILPGTAMNIAYADNWSNESNKELTVSSRGTSKFHKVLLQESIMTQDEEQDQILQMNPSAEIDIESSIVENSSTQSTLDSFDIIVDRNESGDLIVLDEDTAVEIKQAERQKEACIDTDISIKENSQALSESVCHIEIHESESLELLIKDDQEILCDIGCAPNKLCTISKMENKDTDLSDPLPQNKEYASCKLSLPSSLSTNRLDPYGSSEDTCLFLDQLESMELERFGRSWGCELLKRRMKNIMSDIFGNKKMVQGSMQEIVNVLKEEVGSSCTKLPFLQRVEALEYNQFGRLSSGFAGFSRLLALENDILGGRDEVSKVEGKCQHDRLTFLEDQAAIKIGVCEEGTNILSTSFQRLFRIETLCYGKAQRRGVPSCRRITALENQLIDDVTISEEVTMSYSERLVRLEEVIGFDNGSPTTRSTVSNMSVMNETSRLEKHIFEHISEGLPIWMRINNLENDVFESRLQQKQGCALVERLITLLNEVGLSLSHRQKQDDISSNLTLIKKMEEQIYGFSNVGLPCWERIKSLEMELLPEDDRGEDSLSDVTNDSNSKIKWRSHFDRLGRLLSVRNKSRI